MKAVIGRTSSQALQVKTNGGIIQTQTPITLKNQITEIRSIEDILDVSEVNVTSGATLVYNAVNDKYEVKKLGIADINTDTLNLDGGEF